MVIAAGAEVSNAVNLGEIDGSGKQTIAISYDYYPHAYKDAFPGGVIFVQGTTDVPVTGWYRATPDEASGVGEMERSNDDLNLRVLPNPGNEEVRIVWSGGTTGDRWDVRITDVLGREVLQRSVEDSDHGVVWSTTDVVRGVYWVTLRSGDRTKTTRITLQ
jgi:hypothetical protein